MDQQNVDEFCHLIIDRKENNEENEIVQSNFNGTPVTVLSAKSKNEFVSNLLEITSFENQTNLALIAKAGLRRPTFPEQATLFENAVEKNKTFKSPQRQNFRIFSKSSIENPDGSPLKLHAIADLSDFESPGMAGYDSPVFFKKEENKNVECGLNARHARYLLSMYSVGLFQNCLPEKPSYLEGEKRDMPSLAILCDGKGIKNIACISIEQLVRKSEKSRQPVGTRSTIVTIQKPMTKDCLPEVSDELALTGRQVQYQSQYDIFGAAREDRLHSEYCGSLILELQWNKFGDHLSLLKQPPLSAHAVVKAQVTSGDMRSAAYVFYRELSILSSIIFGITDAEVCWHSNNNDKPLLDCVKDLVENLKMGDARPVGLVKLEQTGHDLSAVFDNLFFDARKDLDFTDYLWQVLQNCSAYTELVQSLDYVLTVLDNGELQPVVHKSNTTALARLVRDSYEGKMNKPCLVGLFPLQILAEIGIKKLRHDYINAFLSNDLATLAHLDKFILPDKSTKLSTNLESLEKLQNVLEMVVMLKLFIDVPHATLSSVVRQMLKHYETNVLDESHVFTFTVPTESITEILKNCAPCMWKVTAVKVIDGFNENISYMLSTKQPFLHLPSHESNGEINLTKDSNSDIHYHLLKRQDSVSILV